MISRFMLGISKDSSDSMTNTVMGKKGMRNKSRFLGFRTGELGSI